MPSLKLIFKYNQYIFYFINLSKGTIFIYNLLLSNMKNQTQAYFDVIIVGGGISAIAAARALSQSSLTWVILQANHKLGGRIQNTIIDGCKIDLGAYQLASFCQKRPSDNSLYQLIKTGYCELNYRQSFNKIYYYEDTGSKYSSQQVENMQKMIEELRDCVNIWTKQKEDMSVAECYDRFQKQGHLQQLTQSNLKLFELMLLMEQQEQAADAYDLAADSFFADGDMEEDCLDAYPLPSDTYCGLVKKLIDDLPQGKNIQLSVKVNKIKYNNKLCEVSLTNMKEENREMNYISKFVICTVPLSIIKSNQIIFQPPLPEKHQFILENLGYGYMEKIILAFQQPFWPIDAQRIKISSKFRGKFPHFSNLSGPKASGPEKAFILCCYITSEYAKDLLSNKSDPEIIEMALLHLKQTFPEQTEKIKLKDAVVTRWMKSNFIQGSFSYIRPKLRYKNALQIREPILERLYLAGEYCYPENIGCAHGAYETGWQAGKKIVDEKQK